MAKNRKKHPVEKIRSMTPATLSWLVHASFMRKYLHSDGHVQEATLQCVDNWNINESSLRKALLALVSCGYGEFRNKEFYINESLFDIAEHLSPKFGGDEKSEFAILWPFGNCSKDKTDPLYVIFGFNVSILPPPVYKKIVLDKDTRFRMRTESGLEIAQTPVTLEEMQQLLLDENILLRITTGQSHTPRFVEATGPSVTQAARETIRECLIFEQSSPYNVLPGIVNIKELPPEVAEEVRKTFSCLLQSAPDVLEGQNSSCIQTINKSGSPKYIGPDNPNITLSGIQIGLQYRKKILNDAMTTATEQLKELETQIAIMQIQTTCIEDNIDLLTNTVEMIRSHCSEEELTRLLMKQVDETIAEVMKD